MKIRCDEKRIVSSGIEFTARENFFYVPQRGWRGQKISWIWNKTARDRTAIESAKRHVKSESLLKKVLRIALVGHGGFSVLCPVRFELPLEISNFHNSQIHFPPRVLNSVFHGATIASGNPPVTCSAVFLAVKVSMLTLSWSTNLWQMLQQKILRIEKSLLNCWRSTRISNGSLWRISSSTLGKLSWTSQLKTYLP